jgi:hypothetical protein
MSYALNCAPEGDARHSPAGAAEEGDPVTHGVQSDGCDGGHWLPPSPETGAAPEGARRASTLNRRAASGLPSCHTPECIRRAPASGSRCRRRGRGSSFPSALARGPGACSLRATEAFRRLAALARASPVRLFPVPAPGEPPRRAAPCVRELAPAQRSSRPSREEACMRRGRDWESGKAASMRTGQTPGSRLPHNTEKGGFRARKPRHHSLVVRTSPCERKRMEGELRSSIPMQAPRCVAASRQASGQSTSIPARAPVRPVPPCRSRCCKSRRRPLAFPLRRDRQGSAWPFRDI